MDPKKIPANEKQLDLCHAITMLLNKPFDLSSATIYKADQFIIKYLDSLNRKRRELKGIAIETSNYDFHDITL